jgi:hypothetical protein
VCSDAVTCDGSPTTATRLNLRVCWVRHSGQLKGFDGTDFKSLLRSWARGNDSRGSEGGVAAKAPITTQVAASVAPSDAPGAVETDGCDTRPGVPGLEVLLGRRLAAASACHPLLQTLRQRRQLAQPGLPSDEHEGGLGGGALFTPTDVCPSAA